MRPSTTDRRPHGTPGGWPPSGAPALLGGDPMPPSGGPVLPGGDPMPSASLTLPAGLAWASSAAVLAWAGFGAVSVWASSAAVLAWAGFGAVSVWASFAAGPTAAARTWALGTFRTPSPVSSFR